MRLSKLFKAIEIFLEYDDSEFIAEHEEIFLCSTPPTKMNAEDVSTLNELGFSWNDTLESWQRFV